MKTKDAFFSIDRKYRYVLWRRWGQGRLVNFIMLNPSTADEVVDDPTIRRCVGFATRWGYDQLAVTNLFALRATYPSYLLKDEDPVGPQNDAWLKGIACQSDTIVFASGVHGTIQNRESWVKGILDQWRPFYCLGLTKAGRPKHPLRLSAELKPVVFL